MIIKLDNLCKGLSSAPNTAVIIYKEELPEAKTEQGLKNNNNT
jgi:hypothetical protein